MREVTATRETRDLEVFFFVIRKFPFNSISYQFLLLIPVRSSPSQSPPLLLHSRSLSCPHLNSWLLLKKAGVRNGERNARTRRMDGWNPVVGSNASNIGGGGTGGKDRGWRK